MAAPPTLAAVLGAAAAATAVTFACFCSTGGNERASDSGRAGEGTGGSHPTPDPSTADILGDEASMKQCRANARVTGPPVRSFGSAKPPVIASITSTTQTQQQQDVDGSATTAAPDTPTIKVRVAEDGVKLRSCAGRFSPIVSAPAGSKLPGYNRKPPAGGRRQAAPLLAGTTVNIVGRGVDKTGAPWFRVETDDGVSGWLAQGSVDVRTTN